MELDDRIDSEDDENTSDGEVGRVVKEMVCTTHPHSLLFLNIYIYIYIPSPRPPPPWGGAVRLKHLFEVATAIIFWCCLVHRGFQGIACPVARDFARDGVVWLLGSVNEKEFGWCRKLPLFLAGAILAAILFGLQVRLKTQCPSLLPLDVVHRGWRGS